MTELITHPQADLLLHVVLAVGLLLAAAGAFVARKSGKNAIAVAAVWGGPFVLAALMWRGYNAITDRLGLDSVLNLVANAVLFVVVGAACGLAWARLSPQGEPITGDAKDETR